MILTFNCSQLFQASNPPCFVERCECFQLTQPQKRKPQYLFRYNQANLFLWIILIQTLLFCFYLKRPWFNTLPTSLEKMLTGFKSCEHVFCFESSKLALIFTVHSSQLGKEEGRFNFHKKLIGSVCAIPWLAFVVTIFMKIIVLTNLLSFCC